MNLSKDEVSPAAAATNLDRQLVNGIAWTASLRWVGQIISWAALAYAVRVLTPGDFGLLRMATSVIGVALLAEDFGLDIVLLQDRSLDGQRRARLVGFAILLGVVLMFVFLALAVPLANFNNEPTVAIIVAALSLRFVIDAIQILPRAMLQRELQFQRLAILGLVQTTVTSGVLVLAARAGLSFYSLIVNTLAGLAVSTALLLWWHPYKVEWPRDLRSILTPILQGWRVLMSRVAWYGYNNFDATIIGKMLGKDTLGIYAQASDLAKQPMEEITSSFSRVVPGVFTRVQNNMPEMRRYFLILTEFLSYLALPVGAGIALTADRIVAVALGPQWQGVVVPLQILCLYTAFLSAQALVAHILLWTGQLRAVMWCSILTAAMLMPSYYLAVKLEGGIVAVAWMWTILFPISNIPPLVIGFRTIKITFGDWLGVLRAPLVACAAMAVVVITVRLQVTSTLQPFPALVIEAAAGASVYVATLLLVFRPRLMAIVETVRAVRRPQSVAVTAATEGA